MKKKNIFFFHTSDSDTDTLNFSFELIQNLIYLKYLWIILFLNYYFPKNKDKYKKKNFFFLFIKFLVYTKEITNVWLFFLSSNFRI
jgi:hypothetical protein